MSKGCRIGRARGSLRREIRNRATINLALKILDGADVQQIARFGDEMKKSEPDVKLDEASFQHEDEIKRKQDEMSG